ncbi:VOC family protein [Rhodococcus sp. HNM0569]|uniref:VOC family protein n=1 Tax=Rhodococcus sp. HNM0569 TaxID=2716340 RepID=UPI00146BC79D|nr:VOC family protein [Rhodococcus sp. HNM0569]NLU82955.1 VOC family protein [Rhodococcus sp. HNM0569]
MPMPTLGSLLLSSTKPRRLRDWYVAVFEVHAERTPDDAYDVLGFGSDPAHRFWVMIDSRDDVGDANPEPGRFLLNIEVDDAEATARAVDAAGGRWLAPLENRDGSLFGTAIDPDGNYIQLIQLSDQARAEMEG